jgi:hypothetical protein
MGEQSVILFPTSAHVMRAEKLLKEAGLSCRLIPVPRHLSSDCGICLVVLQSEADAACALLKEKHVDYDSVADSPAQ